MIKFSRTYRGFDYHLTATIGEAQANWRGMLLRDGELASEIRRPVVRNASFKIDPVAALQAAIEAAIDSWVEYSIADE